MKTKSIALLAGAALICALVVAAVEGIYQDSKAVVELVGVTEGKVARG